MNDSTNLLRLASKLTIDDNRNEIYFPAVHDYDFAINPDEAEEAKGRVKSLMTIMMGGKINKYELAEVLQYIGDMLEE
ncbi:hypothetical protein [Sedimentisphaera salicampi]|uniref:Uncharacterized protein n=1 Tax=Sedimentisphaera salicampi TaxID=1941349 RepID=A0A1W6LQ86_9BACT|nr:hypothetical protein [Sedimentisphaera salicampi]ARN57965.1 hypothetical protein STSP1_02391 [Sedimentisphaera salicampi]